MKINITMNIMPTIVPKAFNASEWSFSSLLFLKKKTTEKIELARF